MPDLLVTLFVDGLHLPFESSRNVLSEFLWRIPNIYPLRNVSVGSTFLRRLI